MGQRVTGRRTNLPRDQIGGCHDAAQYACRGVLSHIGQRFAPDPRQDAAHQRGKIDHEAFSQRPDFPRRH